jgi:hypothetical protein
MILFQIGQVPGPLEEDRQPRRELEMPLPDVDDRRFSAEPGGFRPLDREDLSRTDPMTAPGIEVELGPEGSGNRVKIFNTTSSFFGGQEKTKITQTELLSFAGRFDAFGVESGSQFTGGLGGKEFALNRPLDEAYPMENLRQWYITLGLNQAFRNISGDESTVMRTVIDEIKSQPPSSYGQFLWMKFIGESAEMAVNIIRKSEQLPRDGESKIGVLCNPYQGPMVAYVLEPNHADERTQAHQTYNFLFNTFSARKAQLSK